MAKLSASRTEMQVERFLQRQCVQFESCSVHCTLLNCCHNIFCCEVKSLLEKTLVTHLLQIRKCMLAQQRDKFKLRKMTGDSDNNVQSTNDASQKPPMIAHSVAFEARK